MQLAPQTATGISWVPPFGAAPLAPRASRAVRGLRQAAMAIKLTRQDQRRADTDPDASLGLPPPGDYEYFSTPAGSRAAVLLALDPAKGLLYLLLPTSKRWELLEHDGGGLLAESRCARSDWRCELAVDGLRSLLFLPTESGLACLSPDAASLGFEVDYIGDAPAIGAPLQFGEQVWAPLRLADGGIRFVSASVSGEAGAQVDLPATSTGVSALGALHAPLADGRTALWPCDNGQLLLRKQASGALVASFQAWPAGVQPSFEFGSPYLSRDGSLWQLCFDTQHDSYIYLQLGVDKSERASALAPRLCSGSFNFRFATKFKSEPWLEPEHGDDGGSDEVVLPLLESTSSVAVLGLKLETTAGLADLLRSSERMRAVLVLDDASSQTAFHMLVVAEPWRLRVFIHAGLLWAYHPLLSRLDGWTLQP
ncbi:hypothetical protein RA876_16505 [Rhodoferax antarcticus]|nr:hypothetical protein RA876_16505 [Rhodoferax antarcticus]